MITIKNNTPNNYKLQFKDETLYISENETKTISKDIDKTGFTILPNDNKLSFLGALFIVLFSIVMIFFEKLTCVKFKDYLKLPIKVYFINIGNDINFEIVESNKSFYCADINSNCDNDIDLVYDKELINKEVKQFHLECILSLIVPITPFIVLTLLVIINKNIAATIVLLLLLVAFFFIWMYFHNQNQKLICELLQKASE